VNRTMLSLIAGLALTSAASAQTAPPVRTTSAWNLAEKSQLAIKGYDPVAYFTTSIATPGKADITTDYNGATYQFASTENRNAFLADPAKYEPAHGGWCSWAMKDGEKVEIDPKQFIVKNDRLFLFYNGFWGDTRAKWLKEDHAAQTAKADAQWKKLSGEDARTGTTKMTQPANSVLKPKLDEMRESFAKRAPSEVAAIYEQGIRDVGTSGVLDSALKVGAIAPDFSLPDATGKTVALNDMLAKGPVVITWYRGGWCPYCNLQLREYQKMLPTMQPMNAQLVAISPQTPDNSLSTSQKDELSFAVLSDSGNAVAKKFGIAYKLPDAVAASFKGKLDLEQYNGDASGELPLSATYVIAPSGKIMYAFVDADYRNRAEPADILAAVASAVGK
jgi:peroxiredoxin/YHS domain-containing protein